MTVGSGSFRMPLQDYGTTGKGMKRHEPRGAPGQQRRLTGTRGQVRRIQRVAEMGRVFVGPDGCATPVQYVRWAELFLSAPPEGTGTARNPRTTFCGDCRAEYRAEMTEQGKCWRARQEAQ